MVPPIKTAALFLLSQKNPRAYREREREREKSSDDRGGNQLEKQRRRSIDDERDAFPRERGNR